MRAPRVTDRDEREQRYLRNIRNAKATCVAAAPNAGGSSRPMLRCGARGFCSE
jgi:hypothetical protein